ncbi:MAG: hypothetical protein KF870_01730 [Leadbetterella sp.]|nr:hypothetical protein [Leadbetterella sp.]
MSPFEYLYLAILFILGVYSAFTLKKGVFIIKLYAIVTLLTEAAGYFYLYKFNHAFTPLYNVFTFFEIGIWLAFYFQITQRPLNFRFWLILGVCVLLLSYLGGFDISLFNHQGIVLNNLIVTFLIGLYFFHILRKNLDLDGYFIIMAGALFYHTGGVLLNGLIMLIANTDLGAAKKLYNINSVLNIFFYGLILWGLISKDRETKVSLSE